MPSFTDSLACACPSWNEFSGLHNPTHVWHRWCITTVNELRNSGWLPLAPEPPPRPGSVVPEFQPCSSISCLLGTDSVRYYMRHQQQRFLPGANDFFSKVGSTWVDITWITDVLVWIDLRGPSSSPSPEGVESSFPPRQSGFMYSKSVIQPRHHLGRIHIYWDGSVIPQTCLELLSWNLMRSWRAQGDVPGGPVVKTLHLQCRGYGFHSWLDN